MKTKLNIHRPAKSNHRKTRKIEFCPVYFTMNGTYHQGYLVDISEEGAKIRLKDKESDNLTLKGDIRLDIHTPYGTSSCDAIVQWIEQHDGGDSVGLHFFRVPSDRSDPVRCLIDSLI